MNRIILPRCVTLGLIAISALGLTKSAQVANAAGVPCPAADAAYKAADEAQTREPADWLNVADDFADCLKSLRDAKSLSTVKELSIQMDRINAYQNAIKLYRRPTGPDLGEQLAKTKDALASVERAMKTALGAKEDAEQLLQDASIRIEELETKLKALSEPKKLNDVMPYERFSLPIEAGYSAGRLTRSVSQTIASHNGGFFHIAAMPRFPFKGLNVMFGPYYMYWRAIDRTMDDRLTDARVHSLGVRLEMGIELGKRVKHYFTLHPMLELGMDFVRFDANLAHPTDPGYVNVRYLDMVGMTIGGGMSLCFAHAIVCVGTRLRSVPGEWSLPTTQFGLRFDPVRLVTVFVDK